MSAPVAALTVSERAAVAVAATLSVTRTVKALVPVALGVPEITPAALRERPVGRVPTVTVHEP